MQKIFEDYRKPITICAGLIFFLLVGAFTMIFNKPDAPITPTQTREQTPPVIQPAKKIFVHVTGAVRKPGVYELARDARIFHAVEIAGGLSARADEASLNLAETLTDGAHIHIPSKQEPQTPAQTPATQTQTTQKNSSGLVDVNHANAKELENLTGVGPAISKRIVDYRNTHGAFSKPEDLLRVKGIGEAKLKKMRGQILIR